MNSIKVCSCCLSEDNLIEAIDEPLNILSKCFSIQITSHIAIKEFSVYICNLCIKKLNCTYSFRCQILETQIKLKNLFSLADFNDSSQVESDDGMFKTEYLIEEDLQSNFENTADDDLKLSLINYENEIPLSNVCIQSETKMLEINDNKDFMPVKQSIIKTSKNRNDLRSMSPETLIRYKRLSNRCRYAEAIPFKLDKSALTCEICKETFSTHKYLVSHMSVHYPNYICDLCGKSFVLRIHLIGHIKTHDMEKISCNVCSKLLKKSSMTRHLRTHTGSNNSYACPHCAERFVSFNTRVKHMEKVHDIDIYKYHCKICSKKFHLASSLSKHVRRCHFQEMNVACDECGKGFFDKKSLVEHMLKHTGERNHRCNICSKSYVRGCSLKEHLKTHGSNNEENFNCDKKKAYKNLLKSNSGVYVRKLSDRF